MTTDRPTAPTRSTALADRSPAGGRSQAPPTDAFSALLGAAAPKSDAPARRDDAPSRWDAAPRRDDGHRRDDGPRRMERRAHQRDDAAAHRAAHEVEDKPVADAPDATNETDVPEDAPATPTAPSIFALQLASPLPPATPTTAPTAPATGTAPAADASAETAASTLPVFGGLVPASVATATAGAPAVAGAVTATDPTAVADAAAGDGAIAIPGLPAGAEQTDADAEFVLPEGFVKPQTPAATAAGAAAAQATPAQGASVTADGAQQEPGADSQSSGQPNTALPTATPTPTAASAQQAKTEAAAQAAPAPQPVASTTTPPVMPVAPSAQGTPNVERAVPLSRSVLTTGTLLHLASERGITHARLNLKPVELGGIEVKLQSTPQGIHAQLVADSPEAAKMLAQAGDQLRQQLSDRDVNLLSLDVSTSSDQRNDQPGFSTGGFGDDYRPGGSAAGAHGLREDAVLMDTPAAAETTLVLPDGVHVDVLA